MKQILGGLSWVVAGVVGVLVVATMMNFPLWVTSFPVNAKVSRNYFYNPINGSVYHSTLGNWFELDYGRLNGVSSKDFRVLGADVAATKQAVYYQDQRLDLDPASAKFDAAYIWDRRRVYILEGFVPTELRGMDGASFENLGHGFSRDRSSARFRATKIDEITRPEGLKVLDAEEPVALYEKTLYFPIRNDGPGKDILGFRKWPVKDASTIKIVPGEKIFHGPDPGDERSYEITFDGREVNEFGVLKK